MIYTIMLFFLTIVLFFTLPEKMLAVQKKIISSIFQRRNNISSPARSDQHTEQATVCLTDNVALWMKTECGSLKINLLASAVYKDTWNWNMGLLKSPNRQRGSQLRRIILLMLLLRILCSMISMLQLPMSLSPIYCKNKQVTRNRVHWKNFCSKVSMDYDWITYILISCSHWLKANLRDVANQIIQSLRFWNNCIQQIY